MFDTWFFLFQVSLSDLPLLASLNPQFKKMFAEALEEIKIKHDKRMNSMYRDQVIKADLRESR